MQRESSTSVRRDAVPLDTVVDAAREWARGLKRRSPEIVKIGYFGSYARGDYVPGSDFDVLIEVTGAGPGRRADRAAPYQPASFPLGMELFVYTCDELKEMRTDNSAFLREIEKEWVELT